MYDLCAFQEFFPFRSLSQLIQIELEGIYVNQSDNKNKNEDKKGFSFHFNAPFHLIEI
jgi:hypothetical protein